MGAAEENCKVFDFIYAGFNLDGRRSALWIVLVCAVLGRRRRLR